MKIYLIVGEASGDLHASNLMKALRHEDPKPNSRFFGGDLMTAVGGTRVSSTTANWPTWATSRCSSICLSSLPTCACARKTLVNWQPERRYPGGLSGIQPQTSPNSLRPTLISRPSIISPQKIWAWKTYRIKNIKRDVAELFSILPFEVEFYRSYGYPVHYVGNPCVDAVANFRHSYVETREEFICSNGLDPHKPIIALLAGSRKQEIKDNLPDMIRAASGFTDYQMVLAGAPGIDPFYYDDFIRDTPVKVVYRQDLSPCWPMPRGHGHLRHGNSGDSLVPRAAGRLLSYAYR